MPDRPRPGKQRPAHGTETAGHPRRSGREHGPAGTAAMTGLLALGFIILIILILAGIYLMPGDKP
jgi:hypothetical protein